MSKIDKELENMYETWFPMLSYKEDGDVRAGFEAWLADNYVKSVSANYAEDPELLKKCISVLMAPLQKMDSNERKDYLKLYPCQEELMKTARRIWEAAKNRYLHQELLPAEMYQVYTKELFERMDYLKAMMAETSGTFREKFEKIESDAFLDLEYARGNTELMSDFMKERLE